MIIHVAAATILGMRRRFDEAIATYRHALEMEPNFYRARLGLGRTYVDMGRYAEGIALFRDLMETHPFSITSALLGHALALDGRSKEAEALAQDVMKTSRTSYVSPYVLARIYMGFPDKNRAFEWLEKAFDERDSRLIHLKAAPIFDCLRGDPRYYELLRKIGLDRQVTVSGTP